MKLTLYPLADKPPNIRPAERRRDWMDESTNQFAYRCLPLVLANAHGWEILNNRRFTATWNGERPLSAITIRGAEETDTEHAQIRASSHFGGGVLTFEMPMLVETEPGWNLMVQGPINRAKDGIAPLQAVVETDWSPYTFTMNWRFTRAFNRVRFEVGEPICHIFPVKRGTLEAFEPEIASLHDQPEKLAQYETWRGSRSDFISDLKEPGSEAAKKRWQRSYFQGTMPDGSPGSPEHQTKISLKPFKR